MIVVGLTVDVEGEGADARYFLKTAYAEAVRRAGALPLLLPHLEGDDALAAVLDRVDAVVVTGGAFDVPPELYGEAPREGLGVLKAGRTRFEAELTRGALARDLPFLGVCGGMQLLAALRGGTLYQDLGREAPGSLGHEQAHDRREPAHAAVLEPGTRLHAVVGRPDVQVNSTHHQAVRAPGPELVVSARAPDGVIEAIEDPAADFVVGVQWHPELLAERDPAQQAVYDALVAAAREARARRRSREGR